MTFKCKIGLHSWNGCKCSECEKTRDEQHDWNGCKCSVCGKLRDEQHGWKGCKCSVCGKVRDEQHDWNWCHCSVCYKARNEHDWNGCKCSVCGIVRDEQHDWNGCKCTKCDISNDEKHIWKDGKCTICDGGINDFTGNDGSQLIYRAVKINNLKEIEVLISNGADVNQKTISGDTPLCLAIENCNIKTIELLLSKGADINLKRKDLDTPLCTAIRTKNKKVVEILVSNGADINLPGKLADPPILRAFHEDSYKPDSNSVDIFRTLAENGANLNYTLSNGNPLIFLAISEMKKEIIEIMISNGADVNICDKRGRITPLHFAFAVKEREKLEGSKRTQEENNLSTLLINEIIELLLKNGAK